MTKTAKADPSIEKHAGMLAAMAEKYGNGTPPEELLHYHSREELPAFVRLLVKAGALRHEVSLDAATAQMLENATANTAVGLVERLVEGDIVLDNAATHRWLRRALQRHRDLAILYDDWGEAIEDKAAFTALLSALRDFDVLFSPRTEEPSVVGVIANTKARPALEGRIKRDEWDCFFSRHNEWKYACLRLDGPGGLPPDPLRSAAAAFARQCPELRVGVLKRFGKVDPVAPFAG
jgi:hypothetical protein